MCLFGKPMKTIPVVSDVAKVDRKSENLRRAHCLMGSVN